MPTYYTNELAFDLPDPTYVDKTVNVLEWSSDAGEVGIFIHRAPLPENAKLRDVVTGQLEQERRTLAAHAILFQREAKVANQPATIVGTRWRGNHRIVYQELAFFIVDQQWILIGVNGSEDRRATVDDVMSRVLATFELR